jgi:hypothetical protein
MKTRRHTVDSRSLLSGNESLDTFASPLPTLPLTTTSDDVLANKTLKSNVWEHFEQIIDTLPLKAKCLLCQEELLTPNYATSSLRRHLIQRHGLQKFGSTETLRPSEFNRNLSKKENEKLDSLAVDAIIQDSRVFNNFQKSGLKKCINALRPGKDFLLFSSE